MRRSLGLVAALVCVGVSGSLLPACEEPSEEDVQADSNEGASTNEGAPTDQTGMQSPGAPADASKRMGEQGTFDGTIIAAAMEGTVGGGKGPFWLYKGGVSPKDEDGLLPIPAEAIKHRAANPDLWPQWRRAADGTVERMAGGKWQPLDFDDEYAALAKGATFAGTFESHNAVADIAGRIRKYRFSTSGTYEFCELFLAGTSTSRKRASGTYEVDGFVIRLTSKTAAAETFSLVYDPSLRPNTMWIDRSTYTRNNGASATAPLDC